MSAQLGVETLSSELAEILAERLSRACEQQSSRLGLGFRVRSWVIREEDLGFFNVLRTAALAIVASMTGAGVAAPVVGALAAAAETGWNIWRKGARLEPLELRVLMQLEQTRNACTPKEIARQLSDQTKRWSTKEVESSLKRLSKLPTRSGTIAVVLKTSDDRWKPTH